MYPMQKRPISVEAVTEDYSCVNISLPTVARLNRCILSLKQKRRISLQILICDGAWRESYWLLGRVWRKL